MNRTENNTSDNLSDEQDTSDPSFILHPYSLTNVVVVLYQPQDVVNIGGVVRVMSNFGLSRLRLVAPVEYDPVRVEGIAHHTRPIINAIEHYATLEEAIADCGFTLGTTGKLGSIKRERITPRQAAPLVLAAANDLSRPTALLFGREDDGLPNEALDYCHAILTIQTAPENRSLNLAQAALIVAYELWLAANPQVEETLYPNITPAMVKLVGSGEPPRYGEIPSVAASVLTELEEDAQLANHVEREELFTALAALLRQLYPATSDSRMVNSMTRLRAVLLRAAPRMNETRMLTHLFQHINRLIKK